MRCIVPPLRCLVYGRVQVILCAAGFAATALAASADVNYRVQFRGVDDRTLKTDLENVSDLVALRERPPASVRQLERRAEADQDRFLTILRAHGYYAASVETDMDTARDPVRVRVMVEAGPRYVIGDVRAQFIENGGPGRVEEQAHELAGLSPGTPAVAREVLRAEARVVRKLGEAGYPFAVVRSHEARLDDREAALDVTFYVERGPSGVFGETTFEGLDTVDESYVRKKLPWKAGAPFDGALVRSGQRRLMGADLFASARVVRSDQLDEEGGVPLTVVVRERKHRSVSVGAGYRSDVGVRARIGWEHRNLAGRGEQLALLAEVTEIGYDVESRYKKPDYLRLEQNLILSLRTSLEEPDAFRSRGAAALGVVERRFPSDWVGSVGVGLKYAEVRQRDEQERFGLFYVPLTADWDRSDDVLDPQTGWRLSLSGAPYRDMLDGAIHFVKLRAALAAYVPLWQRHRLYGAARLMAGSISGATRNSVPADERFYAGGGGSVRGYAYQSVGPLEGNDPVGGRSLAVASAEVRWRLSRDFGAVIFADGGQVQETSVPESTDNIQWGAGVGFRYFTPVGPLRFDVAVPLNKRSGVDDDYQFYISLGQAY